jgi:hypothetical protein
MSARDELAEVIDNVNDVIGLFTDERNKIADAVLEAGYAKPQVITIIEELLELEEGTVIRDSVDEVLFLQGREDYIDWFDQWGNCCHVHLPATVLFVPEVKA